MTTHPNIEAADTYTDDINPEIAELVAQASKPADLLDRFTAGHEIDVERLALDGTDEQLEAWRTTRLADARLRELMAHWRDHWKRAVRVLSGVSGLHPGLEPRGLDLYAWTDAHLCDHETVRLGATYRQTDGIVTVTRVHVDLVRVAQQPTTFRLLGPTEALEIVGPEGIVQEAHPLRVATQYAGHDAIYRPNAPTWLPPKLEPPTPTNHGEGLSPASARNRALEAGATPLGDSGYSYSRP